MKENGTGKGFLDMEVPDSRPSKPPMFFRRPQDSVRNLKGAAIRDMSYREKQRELHRRNKNGP